MDKQDDDMGVCSRCGTTENVSFGPDPYEADVNNDPTPVWLCADCECQSAADI